MISLTRRTAKKTHIYREIEAIQEYRRNYRADDAVRTCPEANHAVSTDADTL